MVPAEPDAGVPPVKRRPILLALLVLATPLAPPVAGTADADAPPTVRIVAPEDGAGVARAVRVTGVAYDNDTGVADVQVRVDDGPWHSAALGARGRPAAAWSVSIPVASGAHVIEARATDGRRSSASAFATVLAGDTPPPGVAILAPRHGAGVDGREPLAVAGRVHPPQPDVDVRVRVDDGPWIDADVAGGFWTAAVPFLAPGARTVTAVAAAPSLGASLPAQIRLAAGNGSRAPEVSILAPAQGSGLSGEGERGCAPPPCAHVAGLARGANRVALAVDDGPPVEVSVEASGAWAWRWPLAGAFEGDHVLEARVPGGIPSQIVVRLGAPHALKATLDPLVAPTFTTLRARAEASSPLASVEWFVDGARVAEGADASFSLARPGFHLVVLKARDGEGNEGVATRWVLATNRPPVAQARLAAPPASAGVPTLLDGSGSHDPDGVVAGWSWRVGRDAAWTPFRGEPLARESFPKRGAHEVSLVVRDDQGAVSNPVSFETVVPNARPAAAFTSDRTVATSLDTIRFSDLSTDRDGPGDLAAWHWSFGDGASSRERHPTHRFPRGVFDVTLTVTDALGEASSASRTITIANIAPRAGFTVVPASPLAMDAALFRDASAKLDGEIVAWHWDFGDGNASREAVAHHVYAAAGAYLVRLAVTDDRGATSIAEREIVVLNHPPIVAVAALPEHADALATVTFAGLARDPDGRIARVLWDFGDAKGCAAPPSADHRLPACDPGLDAEGRLVRHAYARSGLYDVTFTAWDDAGASSSARLAFKVANLPPVARVGGPFKTAPGVPVRVSGEGVDPDGRIVRFAWDLDGDGVAEREGGPVAEARFARAGSHPVTLHVTDDEGASSRATGVVLVEDALTPDAPPTLAVAFPQPGSVVRGRVAFHGAAGDDRGFVEVFWLLARENATVSPSGGRWARATGGGSWSLDLDTRGLENGPYDLRVKASDGRAETHAVVPFVVENAPAGIEGLLLTVDEPVVPGDARLVVAGNAHAPATPLEIRARLDEGPWFPVAVEGTRWRLEMDVSREPIGVRTLAIRAYAAPDRFEETTIPVAIARSGPVVVLSTSPAGPVPAFLRLSGLVESAAPPKLLAWRLDQGPWRPVPGLATPWSLVVATADLAPGRHVVQLRAEGLDGASGPVLEVPFVVAAPEPASAPEEGPAEHARGVPAPGIVAAALAAVIARALARGRRGDRTEARGRP